MRNLKRALSLALAAAMLISLMVVGASAASYGDEASISQNEAVEVLTGIGVVGGDQNGNFNPTATLTRAEFCVMIANALTGGTFDRTLFDGASTPFTDVQGHWGASYIAYCYSNGIVAGTSSTTFEPDSTLTAAQAAAILLMALGYNQNNEFAANGQFALNVTRWAQQAGLYNGLSVSANTGISRENTAKLIFNALTNTTPVNYNNLSQAYYTVGTNVLEGMVYSGDQLDPTLSVTYTPEETRYTYTLGYTNFDLAQDSTPDRDAFGRPCSVWGIDEDGNGALEKDICTAVKAPAAVFTAKATANEVANALGGYYLADNATGADNKRINNTTDVNFVAKLTNIQNNSVGSNWTMQHSPDLQTAAEEIADWTANGKLVEFYADRDNVITDVITVTYTVGEVTGVTRSSDRTVYTIDSVSTGVDYVAEDDEDTIVIAGTVAKGDIVTYAKMNNGALYVYPTTSVTGTQTSKTTSNDNVTVATITVSGTEYKVGNGVTGIATFNNSNREAVYYIDQYGYVVETTSTAASTDYAFVVGYNATKSTTIDGVTPAVEIRAVLADGTVGVYTLALKEVTASNVASISGASVGDWVIDGGNTIVYDANEGSGSTELQMNGKLTTYFGSNPVVGYTLDGSTMKVEVLTAASGSMTDGDAYLSANVNGLGHDASGKDVTSVTNGGATILVDSASKYVVYNSTDKVTTVYTGNTSLPASVASGALNGADVVLTANGNGAVGTASVIFVSVSSGFTADTSNYAYVDHTKYTTSGSGSDTRYVYSAVLADGSTITLSTDKNDALDASGLYKYTSENIVADADILCGTSNTSVTNTYYVYDGTLTVSGSMVEVGGVYYNITSDTQVVYIKSGLAEVNGNGGFVVLESKDGAATANVDTIFITVDTNGNGL